MTVVAMFTSVGSSTYAITIRNPGTSAPYLRISASDLAKVLVSVNRDGYVVADDLTLDEARLVIDSLASALHDAYLIQNGTGG